MTQPRYLIDRILPSGQVHIIGGASGSGKTRWSIPTLVEQWQQGKDVLGYTSHPVPWVYISADRPESSLLTTLEDLKVNPADLPYVVTFGKRLPDDVLEHMKVGLQRVPDAKLFFIEGLAGLAPEGKTNGGYKAIRRFMDTLAYICVEQGVTIFGSTHESKAKDGEHIVNPRQRLLGSVAWAAYSETTFLLGEDEDSPKGERGRILGVLPRNAPEQWIQLCWRDGRLKEYEADLDDVFVEQFLKQVGEGNSFRRAEFVSVMLHYLKSEQVADRRLTAIIEAGLVVRVTRGVYRVAAIQ